MGYVFFICGTIFLIAMIVLSWKSAGTKEITELPEGMARRQAKRAERKAAKEAKKQAQMSENVSPAEGESETAASEDEVEKEDYED